MTKIELQNKSPYKDPVFLFTSSSMRLAAYAGLKKLTDKYLLDIKKEIKNAEKVNMTTKLRHILYICSIRAAVISAPPLMT